MCSSWGVSSTGGLAKVCSPNIPLGRFIAVAVAPANKNRVVYDRFCKTLRAFCHEAILACYTEFNNAGGAMLRLQYDDRLLYFPRAVILAVYADFPAGIVFSSF